MRPGELDGATFWFKNEGDVTTGGKADLVFVLGQEAHPIWERVGCDLWYRVRSAPPRSLLEAQSTHALDPHLLVRRIPLKLVYTQSCKCEQVPESTPPVVTDDSLFFTVEVPSLEGSTQQRVGTRIATVGIVKKSLAVGNCIDARLGYDRSGFAEAVVRGKGMPLFAQHENVRRGMGMAEEREQLTAEQMAKKGIAASKAYALATLFAPTASPPRR